jgi:hypothetical protein
VCWHKQSQKRLARIGYTHLGSFASKKGAIAARRKAAKVVHQQFAHH